MIRIFETHKLRKSHELSGKLWDFFPLDGEKKGQKLKVMVPSCLETYPGYENYRGRAAYETSFEAAGNILLECKGISHHARVFIDGEDKGEHYGSYTPFTIYAKDLSPGKHSLRIEVDNTFKEEFSLDIPNDYMSYGGISRGVVLEEIPDVHIRWVHFTPIEQTEGIWTAKVEIACLNITPNIQEVGIKVRIAGKEFEAKKRQVQPGESIIYSEFIRIDNVEEWNMENPALYKLSVELIQSGITIDDLIERVGFRLIKMEGNRLLLNGRPIRIKGFCRHEDHPHHGCALPSEAIAYDLQLIKDLGANSIRTSHYPNDEIFLDMCDQLGILVWEENHARGLGEKEMRNPYFQEHCEQVIREMITTHYNHPSIYIWGILNECDSETEYGRNCYSLQYDLIRSLDSSRPCSSASCKFFTDICQDLPDVCSWNIYPYWYDNETATHKVEHLHKWLQGKGNGAGKPFMITEVGAGAIYGFRNPAHDKWSEEFQAETLAKQLEEISSFNNCMGVYIWQFCDVRVSKEWALSRPRSRNNKGIVDEYRRPKLSYAVVKNIFTQLPNYWDISLE